MNNKMFKLEFGSKVKFYPYRKASIYGVFFEVDRYSKAAQEFEKELNRQAGEKNIDNHTAYTITNRNGNVIHVLCSDGAIRFGNILVEEDW